MLRQLCHVKYMRLKGDTGNEKRGGRPWCLMLLLLLSHIQSKGRIKWLEEMGGVSIAI